MLRNRMLRVASIAAVIVVMIMLSMSNVVVSPAHADSLLGSYAGTIASGPQYDLYSMFIRGGAQIAAITSCDPASPTLDTVLSVFFPGSDSSNINFADVYNDDGGSQACGGFRNSVVSFITPEDGVYTFRVDGFGSSIGGYTLAISDTTGCVALMPLPSTAVVGTFVADATLYSVPGVPISPALTIEAGKSAWVVGQDASGQYYEINWACSVVWVQQSTIGPNYDAVWQGRPLPTNVVNAASK